MNILIKRISKLSCFVEKSKYQDKSPIFIKKMLLKYIIVCQVVAQPCFVWYRLFMCVPNASWNSMYLVYMLISSLGVGYSQPPRQELLLI